MNQLSKFLVGAFVLLILALLASTTLFVRIHPWEIGVKQNLLAKEILPELLEKGGSPKAIVDERGLGMISDPAAITAIVEELLAAHPDEVEAFRGGKNKLQGFFVGQLMKKTGGKADPKLANQILSMKLKG